MVGGAVVGPFGVDSFTTTNSGTSSSACSSFTIDWFGTHTIVY
jgi:hypothetical protein